MKEVFNKPVPATVREIVQAFLDAQGLDGLFRPHECCCSGEDLMKCCFGPAEDCEPGKKVPCDCGEGCGFHIGKGK